MSFMLFRLLFIALLALSPSIVWAQAQGIPAPAHTDDEYADINWPNLTRTLVRLNALNLADSALLDQYSAVSECELYRAYYHDDFKWNQVRQAVKASVKQNIATFPVSYHFDIPIQLQRYDFNTKAFSFTAGTKLNNVNTFVLYQAQNRSCGNLVARDIPRSFRAVLSTPLFIENFPMPEKEAKSLLEEMKEDNNDDRILTASFNLRVLYIEPWRKIESTLPAGTPHYEQPSIKDPVFIHMETRLDSIDFYEDKERTHLVYHYEP